MRFIIGKIYQWAPTKKALKNVQYMFTNAEHVTFICNDLDRIWEGKAQVHYLKPCQTFVTIEEQVVNDIQFFSILTECGTVSWIALYEESYPEFKLIKI